MILYFTAKSNNRRGVTLIETIISVFILALVAFSLYRALLILINILSESELQIAATTISNEQMEIVRNMSYAKVGIAGGIPDGVIPQTKTIIKNDRRFRATFEVRNIDDPFDGLIEGTPADLAPADYKLVVIEIFCVSCGNDRVFTFNNIVAPKELETATGNGALFVQVIDASGNPVYDAHVQVTNGAVNPPVAVSDSTDGSGFLKIIDVPPSVQKYHITADKVYLSKDQTYATSTQNPNPLKPDATVAVQKVTQVTLAIDWTSSLDVSALTQTCAPVPSVPFTATGGKLIGTAPDVLKFSQSYVSDASGVKNIGGLEWDTYNLTLGTGNYLLSGTIPLLPISLAPNTNQNVKLVLKTKTPNGVLVSVQDGVTGVPLEGANTTLSGTSYNKTLVTGRGLLGQTDWSGGEGQEVFSDAAKYFDQDGGVATTAPAGMLTLTASSTSPGDYLPAGVLTSSTFDTGSASTFYQLIGAPESQPVQTGADSARFQLATAPTAEPASWNFVGPDGTPSTYFTPTASTTNVVHSGDRYFRYRVFLQTADTAFTPGVADVSLVFKSSCVPPSQAFFDAVPTGGYTLTVLKSGYQSASEPVTVSSLWQEQVIALDPIP